MPEREAPRHAKPRHRVDGRGCRATPVPGPSTAFPRGLTDPAGALALAAGIVSAAACATGWQCTIHRVGPWLATFHCIVAVYACDGFIHLAHGVPRDARAAAALPAQVRALRDAARQWAGHALLAGALAMASARFREMGPAPSGALSAAFGAAAGWGAAEGVATLALSFRVMGMAALPEGGDDLA